MDKNEQITEKLTGKQSLLLSHILASRTIGEACKQTKIARTTYYQWLKEEPFREALKRQRQELVEEGLEILKGSFIRAVENMVELTDELNPGIKRLACKDVIEFNLKVRELQEIEERIDRIEEKVNL